MLMDKTIKVDTITRNSLIQSQSNVRRSTNLNKLNDILRDS